MRAWRSWSYLAEHGFEPVGCGIAMMFGGQRTFLIVDPEIIRKILQCPELGHL
jgi:hypothetical protein